MKTSLPDASIEKALTGLCSTPANSVRTRTRRQPVHTLYGGAHLFTAAATEKLGAIARRSFDTNAGDVETFASVFAIKDDLAEIVFQRVQDKLRKETIEDLRIDFEDGYGVRSDLDEDGHAVNAALETAKALSENTLPEFFGIRVKSLSPETSARAIRTLDLYLTTLTESSKGELPANFVVTLPKVEEPHQVRVFVEILDDLERQLGMTQGKIGIEVMVETVRSLIAADGTVGLAKIVEAADGRCRGAHFGAYDYTADCGITAQFQDLRHPACDFARHIMQVSLAGTGVHLSDGATTIMPIGPHRGNDLSASESAENRMAVQSAWKKHYDNCRYALQNGFYQGWDLHPAQIPARYAAVYTFFLEGLDAATARLKNFVEKAARATLVGNDFDDAATGQGLLNYFIRAIDCSAITEQEAIDRTGLSLPELRSGSFSEIISSRQ